MGSSTSWTAKRWECFQTTSSVRKLTASIPQDLIKYKGLQIAPAEIEALLISRSEILDAAVIGLPDPQVPGNEIPRAFVVRRLQGKQLTVEEIQHFVRTNLAAHKQLRGGVEFIDEIPRNPSGKILHRKLLETVPKPRQVRL